MTKTHVMISKYLKTLLADNKKVIIPDFGGFVVKRSATGDVISFNSFLKFNDDLLISALQDGEGCDSQQAMKLIKDDVAQMEEELETYGAFDLPGLGSLRKDKKGNIRFVNMPVNEDESSNTESLDDIVQEDEEVVEAESAGVIDEQAGEQMPPKPLGQKKPFNKWLWIVPLVIILFLGLRQCRHKHETQEQILSEQLETPTAHGSLKNGLKAKQEHLILSKAEQALKEDAETIYPTLGKRIAAFFGNLFSKRTPEAEVVVAPKTINDQVKRVMEPLAKDTVSGILVVADQYISVKGKERYHVIVGSFSDPINAKKFNELLIEDDYASEILDRYNGFVAVSMGSYPTLDIAMRVCGERLSETPGVWILVK